MQILRTFLLATAFYIAKSKRIGRKFPIDFDDSDFYLTSRKGGPPSAVIEDIRRGQEGVLVKLRQMTDELENDELKLNNIFYKLGHHDTELKSINNGLGLMKSSERKMETKLNKHAFNVEFLNNQMNELQRQLKADDNDKGKIKSLQKTVTDLESRISEITTLLTNLKSSSDRKFSKDEPAENQGNLFEYVAKPTTLIRFPKRDGDACDKGWEIYKGHCFYLSREKLSFGEAVSYCSSNSGYLVSLTEKKKNILMEVTKAANHYWTSGTDIFTPNRWTFLLSGEVIPRNMWSRFFRGMYSVHSNKRCAFLNKEGLQPARCSHKLNFICEKP